MEKDHLETDNGEKTSHCRWPSDENLFKYIHRFISHSFSILTLIQHYPIGRKNFFLITFNWLANALVYNGLSYYSANLNVSSHLGFFIR